MHAVRQLFVTSTEHQLTSPSRAAPGWTTFRSETSAEGSGWVGLARFERGADWATFRRAVQDTVSDDQQRITKGMATLDGTAVLLGGAVIHPGKPGEFTVNLAPGPHVLFDYLDVVSAEYPRYRPLTVAGQASDTPPPEPAGTVRSVHIEGKPRFEVLGTPSAGKPLAFENAMTRPYVVEAVLFPLPADAAEQELAAYFAAFRDGSAEWPADPPFELNAGFGCLPLSAGARAIMRLGAKPGRYVVVDWLKDPANGVRMAKRGHYRIVELS